MANEFIIKNGLISKGDVEVEGLLKVNGELKETGVVSTNGTTTPNIDGVSIWKINANGLAVPTILPDGTNGQRLTIYIETLVTAGNDITPNNSLGWVEAELSAVGHSLDLLYSSSAGWIIIDSFGATIT